MRRIRLAIAWAIFGTGAVGGVACQNAVDPGVRRDVVIVAGGDGEGIVLVSPHEGRVISRVGPVPRFIAAHATSLDHKTLFLSAFNSIADQRIVAFDLTARRIVRNVQLPESDAGVFVFGNYAITTSPGGERLLAADATRDGVTGIAVLDTASLKVTSFLGRYAVAPRGMTTIAANGAYPSGAVAVVAGRQNDGTTDDVQLFLLDGETLAVRDSARIPAAGAVRRGDVSQVITTSGGAWLYIVLSTAGGQSELHRYDIAERRFTARVTAAATGQIAIDRTTGTLYLTDTGDGRVVPGSGWLYVFNRDLTPSPSIDLRAAATGGVPPVTSGVAVSRDGQRVFVVAGTAARGPLFGPQPRRLLVIDPVARELLDVIPLDDWGYGIVAVP